MVFEGHMSMEYAMWEMPLIQAFALMAWRSEHNPWCDVNRVGTGYIAQEALLAADIKGSK
jgi:hypothetical protein